MIQETLKKILTLNGISILIGIIGGIVGLLSIFIDWNWTINIKWLAALMIFFSFVLSISFLLAYELYKLLKNRNNDKFKVLKYSPELALILVENNKNLEISQTVTIFYVVNNFQVPLALGFVENIQDKFTQIKLVNLDEDFISNHKNEYKKLLNNNKESLDSVQIKNYYRYNG